jgi:uroporphyrinogen-III synthase
MRILITRPEQDAERLAHELRMRGHEPILSPLMAIRHFDGPGIALEDTQAVLATSAHGIRALVRLSANRDVPVFAVGPQTAAAARAAGFVDVRNAGGDAAILSKAVREWASPKAGPLLHVAGQERAGRLAQSLVEAGFSVEVRVLYASVASEQFSPAGLAALSADAVDVVMLFSPRSARLFAEQLQKAGFGARCHNMVALCISGATAEALQGLPLKTIRVAARPDEGAMLRLLDETAAAP